MVYVIDANVLIDANRDYYPRERVPEFWNWLLELCRIGDALVPKEINDEVVPPGHKDDDLIEWMKKNRADIVLAESALPSTVDRVIRDGYRLNATSTDLEAMGSDPALIAYALGHSPSRAVVTTERPKPGLKGRNRKVPDVCRDIGVECVYTYEFIRRLDFRTAKNR